MDGQPIAIYDSDILEYIAVQTKLYYIIAYVYWNKVFFA